MPGQLFPNYFLEEGILHTAAWQESQNSDLDSFRAEALALLEKAASFHTINEASTEMELIRPLFELLGWVDYLPQQGSDYNEEIPDHLLFGDTESKSRASTKPAPQRYPDALAVAESKRFGPALDTRADHGKASSPHAQLLRYLAAVDINSDGRIRWGILTNGPIWRLYDRRALPRASGYYEVDLKSALQVGDDFHALRAFRHHAALLAYNRARWHAGRAGGRGVFVSRFDYLSQGTPRASESSLIQCSSRLGLCWPIQEL